MIYLKVTNLTKSYTTKPLIDHIDFSISKNQKIALVAKNGSGKSTLIKLLMKEIDLSDGEIQRREDINKGYLSQECNFPANKTVREVLFDFDKTTQREHEIQLEVMIDKLKIKPLLDQQIQTLSGGEKKRIMLAKILAGNPPMLVLDEPTNHLDLDMIQRLERYLTQHNTTLLMVTHDRYFLERVCTDIIELDRGKIHHYPGNYSYFLEKKAQREEMEKIHTHKLKQLFKKELDWIRRAPQGRQTKANFREQRFYDIQDNYEGYKNILLDRAQKLTLSTNETILGGKILKIKNLKKSFGDKKIINNLSHEFRHKERLGIIGKNGVGKSTFIKMIMGEEPIDSGQITAGESVSFGYYQQKEITFPDDKRIIDIIPNHLLLDQFLFSANQQHQFANTLSGGEKRRLYLLTILYKNPNFLILDEPTNDLDLVTLGVLEDFLLNYKGCLIIVSHDRYFMDKIADHLFVFKGNGIVRDFWGNYTEYSALKDIENKQENINLTTNTVNQSNEEEPKNPKLSYIEKRELEQLSKDIEKLEKEKDEINKIFNNHDLPFDDIKALSEELGKISRQLEIKEYRWFELMEKNHN